jgi:hypothetical protein
MPKLPRLRVVRRLSTEEFLGHLWGGVFVLMVVVLTVLLVAKGCLEG